MKKFPRRIAVMRNCAGMFLGAGRLGQYRYADACLTLNMHGSIDKSGKELISSFGVEALLSKFDKASRVELDINSSGGFVDEARKIHDLIRQHSAAQKSATVRHVCASAAVTILLAANFRVADRNARLLIHEPSMARQPGERWTADRYRARADNLDRCSTQLLDLYSKRTRGTRTDLKQLMALERDMTLHEAMRFDFIHGFTDEVQWTAGRPYLWPSSKGLTDRQKAIAMRAYSEART